MAETPEITYDLSKFRLKSILNNNSKSKTICVWGHFVDEQFATGERPAIILLEKTAFTEADVNTCTLVVNDVDESESYFCSQTKLKRDFINDIYGNFQCFPKPDINSN